MAVNINSFSVSFRVVDGDGNAIPDLTVGDPPQASYDAQAGASVTVTVPVTNAAGQPDQSINDAVPGLTAGQQVVSAAAISPAVDIPAGQTVDVPVTFTIRTDAVLGAQGTYTVDLVAA